MLSEKEPQATQLIEALKQLTEEVEEIELPARAIVYNFYHPKGIETKPFLDPKHPVRITNFDTVIVSEAFAGLRGEAPSERAQNQIFGVGGENEWLEKISSVAYNPESYEDTSAGRELRKGYLEAITNAAKHLLTNEPIKEGDELVPIERCGGNIARAMGISGISIEVKRLRFDGLPDLLGAGINLSPEIADSLSGKRVRLLEGVVASGSTEVTVMASLMNWGVEVAAVDCDAVIVCPPGAVFARDFRIASGTAGEDHAVFAGGYLDEDWYVRYGRNDPLLQHLGGKAPTYITEQVLGDGGDLTSNI